MKPKVRNHFTTLCALYIKNKFPEDYKLLRSIAENNYTSGTRQYSLEAEFRQFAAKKHQQEVTTEL